MDKDKKQNSGSRPVQAFNEERGLQPAKNPPRMPTVKPPKAEKGG